MFTRDSLKKSLGWLAGLGGIVCYTIAYAFLPQNHVAYSVLLNIADVLVIGVVVGYLSSVAQWSGVFKKDIQDIVMGEKLLGDRKDIESIWENVTKQLLKNKFADIQKPLLTALKNNLPEEEAISYYEDYDADILVEWRDINAGIITTSETMSFFLVTESKKEFRLPVRTFTVGNESDCKIEEPIIEVDGEKAQITTQQQIRNKNNELVNESSVILSGRQRYRVKYTRKKTYNINNDYYIALKSQFLINDISVTLNLPENIEATFIERGTNIDFETVKKTKRCIKMKLKGVIFPKQGYVFALKVTNP